MNQPFKRPLTRTPISNQIVFSKMPFFKTKDGYIDRKGNPIKVLKDHRPFSEIIGYKND